MVCLGHSLRVQTIVVVKAAGYEAAAHTVFPSQEEVRWSMLACFSLFYSLES